MKEKDLQTRSPLSSIRRGHVIADGKWDANALAVFYKIANWYNGDVTKALACMSETKNMSYSQTEMATCYDAAGWWNGSAESALACIKGAHGTRTGSNVSSGSSDSKVVADQQITKAVETAPNKESTGKMVQGAGSRPVQ